MILSRRQFISCAGALAAGPGLLAAAEADRQGSSAAPKDGPPRQLLRDPHFQGGFQLVEPAPGKRVIYGRIGSAQTTSPNHRADPGGPAWDLDQWSSRFRLAAGEPDVSKPGARVWQNQAKRVTVGQPGSAEADLSLRVNSIVEYQRRARKAPDPWVHLLVEQSWDDPPSLAHLASARLRLEARLRRSEFLRTDDYSPDRHAAQFQMFLTLQNRNRDSAGFGHYVWFGIPLYDDRSPFPRAHKARDTGGTSMLIFTPGGEVFSDRSAHGGDWIRVDKELRPLFVEALETAWNRGFLRESRALADYRLTNTNLGWEVPGLFDVEMQVRNLSLEIQPKAG